MKRLINIKYMKTDSIDHILLETKSYYNLITIQINRITELGLMYLDIVTDTQ